MPGIGILLTVVRGCRLPMHRAAGCRGSVVINYKTSWGIRDIPTAVNASQKQDNNHAAGAALLALLASLLFVTIISRQPWILSTLLVAW